MKLKYSTLISNVFILTLIAILGYFVSTRELLLGTDAVVYRAYYLNLDYYKYGDRTFELGYHIFNYIIYLMGFNYSVFLFVFFLSYNLILIKTFNNFYSPNNANLFVNILFLSILLFSSWYVSATLNGLRQGFSLALLYLSFSFLMKKNNKLFCVFVFLSLLFHDSTVLFFPFLFLFLLNSKNLFKLFLLVAVFYPLGFNEYIINILSGFIDLPLHDAISSYSENNEVWKGFQVNFFTYTIFWCLFFYFLNKILFKNNYEMDFLNKCLLILSMFYFVFGFGSFSNRFGFVAWNFLPIIQCYYFMNILRKVKNNNNILIIFSLAMLFLGFLNYYFILRPLV